MWTSTKQDLFYFRTSVYVTVKLSINSKSCTTITTDDQNVCCLQRRKHRGAYATASLRYQWHAFLGVPTPPLCAAATPPQSGSSSCRLAPGARPIQYSPQDLDPDRWAATATEVWNPASRVWAAVGLQSLVHGELVPHPAKRYKNGVRPKCLGACVIANSGHFEHPLWMSYNLCC